MVWHKRFFALLLVLFPTQLGYHFWPDWAMVLGRRVDYLAPTVYLTDILLGATLIFWLWEVALGMKNYELRIEEKVKILFSTIIRNSPFIILATVCIGANIYFATSRMVAIYKWVKVVEFVVLGWYIVKTKPSFSTVVIPLSIGVFYSSIIAIAQFFLQHSIGGPLWWIGERTFSVDTPGIARIDFNFQLSTFNFSLFGLRPYATFSHPNVLGGFLAAVLPLLLNLRICESTNLQMNEQMRRLAQWGLGMTMVLGIIALVLSFSRSAIVVGGIAMVLAIARITNYELGIRNKKNLLIYFLLTVVLLRVFATIDFQEESVVIRQQLNSAAMKLWTASPIFGVGLGNFLVRLPEVLSTRTIYFLQPVHNIYLLMLVEIGAVGLLGFIWILWEALRGKQESKKARKLESGRSELCALRLSLYAFLLLGLVDHYPLTLQQGQLLLVVLVGMTIQEGREVQKVREVQEGKR